MKNILWMNRGHVTSSSSSISNGNYVQSTKGWNSMSSLHWIKERPWKVQPWNIICGEVWVKGRCSLILEVVKVDRRWRCFILNFIIHSSNGLSSLFFLRWIVSILRKLLSNWWTLEVFSQTSGILDGGDLMVTSAAIKDCSPSKC